MNNDEMGSKEAVFVNLLEVDPSHYEELMALLKEGNGAVLRRREGFVSAVLLASADRSRVITVARWASAEAVKPLASDPRVADYVKRTAALAKASPAMFELVADYRK